MTSALGAGAPTAALLADPDHADPVGDAAAARALWQAVAWASGGDWPGITAAEDEVYRFYLPWALAMVRDPEHDGVDPILAVQAAELGLAKAVLAWRGRDSDGFAFFARTAIGNQLRKLPRPQPPLTPATQDADPIHSPAPRGEATPSSPGDALQPWDVTVNHPGTTPPPPTTPNRDIQQDLPVTCVDRQVCHPSDDPNITGR